VLSSGLTTVKGIPDLIAVGCLVRIIDLRKGHISRAAKKLPRKLRTGFGYDVHRLVPGRKFILGGVEIPLIP
jgi:hypothetical protein